jgi:hypothetical protein
MWMLWKHANQSIGATISLVGQENLSQRLSSSVGLSVIQSDTNEQVVIIVRNG